jgi:hypothetical protein
MLSNNPFHPLVNLPKSIELTLYLICADLKSTKFFSGLRKVGLDDCFYRTDFSSMVLGASGFDEVPDDLLDFYFRLIEKHCELIEPNNKSVMGEALIVYEELMGEKKRMEG